MGLRRLATIAAVTAALALQGIAPAAAAPTIDLSHRIDPGAPGGTLFCFPLLVREEDGSPKCSYSSGRSGLEFVLHLDAAASADPPAITTTTRDLGSCTVAGAPGRTIEQGVAVTVSATAGEPSLRFSLWELRPDGTRSANGALIQERPLTGSTTTSRTVTLPVYVWCSPVPS